MYYVDFERKMCQNCEEALMSCFGELTKQYV